MPIRNTPVERLCAPSEFMMVVSANPRYPSVLMELKPSPRQRLVSLDFGYPKPAIEPEVGVHEARPDPELARRRAQVAERIRNLTGRGLEEGVSGGLLVYAARLMVDGSSPRVACRAAFTRTFIDDRDLQPTIEEIVAESV